MTARASALCAFVALFAGGACCPEPYGRLSGEWVLVVRGEGAAGSAATPHDGEPLDVPQSDCFTSATLDQHFGNECDSHVTEGGGGTGMSGDVPLGNHPTPGEVRWYCTGRGVFRVVLTRCAGTNAFSVTEVAVTMQPE